MNKIIKAHHPKKTARSFKYAFRGLFHTLINEANFRIQIIFTVGTVFLGFIFSISTIEWGLLTISLGLLLIAEMINTVIEKFIDVLIEDYHDGAKIIKDISAGFVLITGIITSIIFLLVFWKPFFNLFF